MVVSLRPVDFRTRRWIALIVLLMLGIALANTLLLALTPQALAAPSPNADTWAPNGTVFAVVHSGTTTYLGGAFNSVGPVTGQGVPLNTNTGARVATYPRVNGQVNVCIPDGAGGFYIGGSFTGVGGLARNNVALVQAGFTVDPTWNPGANGTVLALAVSGGNVFAGWSFTNIGGQARNRIAKLNNTTGAAIAAWNPNADNTVNALVFSG